MGEILAIKKLKFLAGLILSAMLLNGTKLFIKITIYYTDFIDLASTCYILSLRKNVGYLSEEKKYEG